MKTLIEVGESIAAGRSRRPHPHTHGCARPGSKVETIQCCGFRPCISRVHCLLRAVNDIFVKCVFEVAVAGSGVEDALHICFVFGEQKFFWRIEVNLERAQRAVSGK